ncbi:hypothetical protein CEXT_812621 [Caerostris extrusa]|uniref:Uncharacterized protein n=1 Tax=Caerostris extrusa TaxID=172846 RepID=A0AAV4N5E4_CAEEX|nr:hypothetical protein CEXT_812621 [Caerostris extrusa]
MLNHFPFISLPTAGTERSDAVASGYLCILARISPICVVVANRYLVGWTGQKLAFDWFAGINFTLKYSADFVACVVSKFK